MTVRALVDIPTTKGTIPAGKVITIPDSVLGRLNGKVEVITEPDPTNPAARISAAMADIDRHHPSHVNAWSILSQESRERIQAATRALDAARPDDLDSALTSYRHAWLETLAEFQAPEPPETCLCCHGHDFWQGRGKRVCRRCHARAWCGNHRR